MWQPEVNVFDETKIKDNLIDYLKSVQTDALKWANNGKLLPDIKHFHKSPRLVSDFPAITFIQASHKAKWEEILEINFSLLLEFAIIHGDKDTLASLATKYAMALESMLVNVPETTLNQDSIIQITSTGVSIDSTFDIQGKYKTQFIEVFQIRVTWEIEASAFN